MTPPKIFFVKIIFFHVLKQKKEKKKFSFFFEILGPLPPAPKMVPPAKFGNFPKNTSVEVPLVCYNKVSTSEIHCNILPPEEEEPSFLGKSAHSPFFEHP